MFTCGSVCEPNDSNTEIHVPLRLMPIYSSHISLTLRLISLIRVIIVLGERCNLWSWPYVNFHIISWLSLPRYTCVSIVLQHIIIIITGAVTSLTRVVFHSVTVAIVTYPVHVTLLIITSLMREQKRRRKQKYRKRKI